MSILTGSRTRSTAPDHNPSSEPSAAEKHLEDMKVIQAEVARLTGELGAASERAAAMEREAVAARADAQAARETARSTQARLEDALAARSTAEATSAAAKEEVVGLRAQIAIQDDARRALDGNLAQAIAAASRQAPAPAAQPPVEYEIMVGARDVNQRLTRAVLRPVKAG